MAHDQAAKEPTLEQTFLSQMKPGWYPQLKRLPQPVLGLTHKLFIGKTKPLGSADGDSAVSQTIEQ